MHRVSISPPPEHHMAMTAWAKGCFHIFWLATAQNNRTQHHYLQHNIFHLIIKMIGWNANIWSCLLHLSIHFFLFLSPSKCLTKCCLDMLSSYLYTRKKECSLRIFKVYNASCLSAFWYAICRKLFSTVYLNRVPSLWLISQYLHNISNLNRTTKETAHFKDKGGTVNLCNLWTFSKIVYYSEYFRISIARCNLMKSECHI